MYTILYMQHFPSADCRTPYMGHQHYHSHFAERTVTVKIREGKSTTDSGLTPKKSFRAEFVAKSPLARAAFNSIPTTAEDEGVFIHA